MMCALIVLSPGVIETEVLSGVLDEETLANYKSKQGQDGRWYRRADIVGDLILNAYQLPQKALVQEICLTPTRQTY